MVSGTDLADLPEDPAAVMDLIYSFVNSWMRPLASDDGIPTADIDAASARLGQPVPQTLRELVQRMGRRVDLTYNQDRLLRPSQWEVDDAGVLEFRVENQSCAVWGVRTDAGDDPPVLARDPATPTGWLPFRPRLSTYLLETVMSESLFSTHTANLELTDDDEDVLRRELTPILEPGLHLWRPDDELVVEWLASEGAIVRIDAHTWAWALARSAADLGQITALTVSPWQTLDG